MMKYNLEIKMVEFKLITQILLTTFGYTPAIV